MFVGNLTILVSIQTPEIFLEDKFVSIPLLMRKSLFILILTMCLLGTGMQVSAQVDPQLRQDIIATGYVHRPLPIHEELSFENFAKDKPAVRSDLLLDMESLDGWTHTGIGEISLTKERSRQGESSLRLIAPSRPEPMLGWGLGRGTCMATYDMGGADWRGYNRLRFSIYPSCEGARTVYLNLYIENDGEIKVPDRYGREGYHEINLKNNHWNDCFIEMDNLARDKVTCIKFAIEVFGRELTMGDTLSFDVDNVLIEKIEDPETVVGWHPARNRILFSTTGYTTGSTKSAIVNVDGNPSSFEILGYDDDRVVFSGNVTEQKTRLGDFRTIDFSSLTTPGRYYIKAGDFKTYPFYIDDNVWEDSAWRLVNFLFVERCGYPVPGKHGSCHTDLHAVYDGKVIPLNGGWHDAGDMSQQTLQTAEISYSLFQMALTAKKKGNTDLYNRLMEEGLWGLDYVLRSRLGGGFRAMSWGTNLWTDGILDTDDDEQRREIRVHDGALENFIMAGIEAYGAMVIENDKQLVSRSLAEGVGLSYGADHFCIFREHRTGLWYVRRSDDIINQGMFVALNGFEYQVYLDVRQVVDTEEGKYAKLHELLNGKGVPDLDVAWQEYHYKDLYAALEKFATPEFFKAIRTIFTPIPVLKHKNVEAPKLDKLLESVKEAAIAYYTMESRFATETTETAEDTKKRVTQKEKRNNQKSIDATPEQRYTAFCKQIEFLVAAAAAAQGAEKTVSDSASTRYRQTKASSKTEFDNDIYEGLVAYENSAEILCGFAMVSTAGTNNCLKWGYSRKLSDYLTQAGATAKDMKDTFTRLFVTMPVRSLNFGTAGYQKSAYTVATDLTCGPNSFLLTGANDYNGTRWFNKEKMDSTLWYSFAALSMYSPRIMRDNIYKLYRALKTAKENAEYKCENFTAIFKPAKPAKAAAKKAAEDSENSAQQ